MVEKLTPVRASVTSKTCELLRKQKRKEGSCLAKRRPSFARRPAPTTNNPYDTRDDRNHQDDEEADYVSANNVSSFVALPELLDVRTF